MRTEEAAWGSGSGDMAETVGLSIGATEFAAVQWGRAALTRHSVLTLRRNRPPELGAARKAAQRGRPDVVVDGFVERVGDPVDMILADGSAYRGEVLVANALAALLNTVDGRGSGVPVGIAHPAHWSVTATSALCRALDALPALSHRRVTVVSDAATAITALRSTTDLPGHGIVALCDFGGTGTSMTLLDAAGGYRPIAPTVRNPDFSGELIDRALLAHVLSGIGASGSVDLAGTSMLESLNRLRGQCRGAKERLCGMAATSLRAELPGFTGDVRLTRAELDDEVRAPLAALLAVLGDALNRNGIRSADLTAVASTGGGAAIPAVTTALSERFRVPVIAAARPDLLAASGAALHAARAPAQDRATAGAPAPAATKARAITGRQPIVARVAGDSDTVHTPQGSAVPVVAPVPMHAVGDAPAGLREARPDLHFEEPDDLVDPSGTRALSYRRSRALAAALLTAFALVSAGAVVAAGSDVSAPDGSSSSPGVPAQAAPVGPAPPSELGPQGAVPVSAPSAAPAADGPPTRTLFVAPASQPGSVPSLAAARPADTPPPAAPPPAASPVAESPGLAPTAPQPPAPALPPPEVPPPPTPPAPTPPPAAPPSATEAPQAPAPTPSTLPSTTSSPPVLQIPEIPTLPTIPQIPGFPSLVAVPGSG